MGGKFIRRIGSVVEENRMYAVQADGLVIGV